MSRGVRNLRQLISESREVRVDDSSEDDLESNDNDCCQAADGSSGPVDSASLSSTDFKYSDHGDSATGNNCETSVELLNRASSADDAKAAFPHFHLRYNNPRPLSDLGYHPACQLRELPKYRPLPAVRSDCFTDKSATSRLTSRQQSAKETTSIDSIDSGFVTSDSPVSCDKPKTVEELEVILQLFDRSVVLVWLEQAKRSVTDISDWCAVDENFINLAHFWLSEFPSDRRSSMFELEYSLLRDKIASGCKSKKPSPEQLECILTTVLYEFPEGRLNGLADAFTFLDHLEALAEKQKRDSLLAAMTFTLRNRQHYECLLAIRSYAVVTIWSAILDQYRSGVDSGLVSSNRKSVRLNTAHGRNTRPSSAPSKSARSRRYSTENSKTGSERKSLEEESTSVADISSQRRMFDAIRLGFEDVVQYLVETHKVNMDLHDANNKTLVFHAVAGGRPPILRYLLSVCQQSAFTYLVNVAADSGNTPLHAAVNRGDVVMVRELLASPCVNVNVINHECNDVTPLLLSAMHGHVDIAELLLNAGADLSRTLSGKTAREIAVDFDNPDVVNLIDQHISH